jgi:hypothetical protein
MPRPKPETPLVPILIRLHPDDVRTIDEIRGETSRPQWIRAQAIKVLAARLAPLPPERVAQVMRELATRPPEPEFKPTRRISGFDPVTGEPIYGKG